jgi:DnaJ-class molecular chaperone
MWLGNSAQICAEYFSRTHLDDEVFEFDGSDVFGSLNNDASKGKNQPQPVAPKNIEVTLKCSMEELYNGAMKVARYTRTKIHPDGRTKTQVQEEIPIEIKPGYSQDKTKLKLRGRGHEEYSHPASDLLISIKRVVDDDTVWARKGDNLIYTHPISLQDSFNAKPI